MPFSFPICLENKQGKERHVVILQDLIEIYAEFFPLEFCRTGCAREGQHVADVGNSSEVHHKALKSKAKARMFCTAILAQIQIPPIIFLFQLEVLHPLLEDCLLYTSICMRINAVSIRILFRRKILHVARAIALVLNKKERI